jgi:hypothetical protein
MAEEVQQGYDSLRRACLGGAANVCNEQALSAISLRPKPAKLQGFEGGEVMLAPEREAAIANAIAAQIGTEQQLMAARMNWNLTFQGFMIASYALVATAEGSAPARELIQGSIIAVGFLVALATLFGVLAASRQSSYLKEHWTRVLGSDSVFPRPFSIGRGSLWGRLPSRGICASLMLLWIALAIAGLGLIRA